MGTVNVEMAMPLKYVSNFWRTLEISLINCEISLDLNCVVCKANRTTTYSITDTKFYIPVVTLSTQDNAKLFQQLKPIFKRTIKLGKYRSKAPTQEQN